MNYFKEFIQYVYNMPDWAQIVFIIYALYAIFYIKTFMYAMAYFKAMSNVPDQINKKYFPFTRPELPKINRFSMFICGMTLGFIRILTFILGFVCLWISLKIVWLNGDRSKPQSQVRRFLVKFVTMFWNTFLLWSLGYWCGYKTVKLHIQDFIQDYPVHNNDQNSLQQMKRPLLVVCNHVGLIEGQILSNKICPGFLVKEKIKNLPILGGCLNMQQGLFVKSSSKESRKKVVQQITERLELNEQNPTMPPVCIFPEGTCGNAKAILQFKRGPFKDLKPMKIYAVGFKYDKLTFFEDYMDSLSVVLLFMSNWYNSITCYEFVETFDPEYLQLDKNDPNSWKIYADKVRFLISQTLKVPKVELSYRNGVLEFGRHLDFQLNKLKGKKIQIPLEEFTNKQIEDQKIEQHIARRTVSKDILNDERICTSCDEEIEGALRRSHKSLESGDTPQKQHINSGHNNVIMLQNIGIHDQKLNENDLSEHLLFQTD